MSNKVYCLMVQSISLTNYERCLLFDIACEMARKGVNSKRIEDPEMEGVVKTDFEEKLIGGIGGVEFFAEVATELGEGKVKFLVRPADIEERNGYDWFPVTSISDLYPDHPSHSAPFN